MRCVIAAVSGASVYILSERGASSREARELAEQENAADLKGGIALADPSQSLHSVLVDVVAEREHRRERRGGRPGAARTRWGRGGAKARGQRAAFVVLKSPAIPSMLIETAYISNPREEQRLRSVGEQQRLAEAIFAGMAGYFRDHPPDGSLFARSTRSRRNFQSGRLGRRAPTGAGTMPGERPTCRFESCLQP